MLNVKALLTKLCQSLIVETGTPTITTTTGTITSVSYAKFRHIVFLTIEYSNSSSVASGGDIFTGTLTNTNLRPTILATGIAYYANKAMVGTIKDTGVILIRNAASTSVAANSVAVMSFTYIIQ